MAQQMRISIEERDALEHSLRSAIEQRSVDVHFQPIIELATGSIRSVETLARWNQPGKGPISPSEFIPVAEESGLIMPLGQLIFETVCQQQVRWRMRPSRQRAPVQHQRVRTRTSAL